jgi:hypothetical protein
MKLIVFQADKGDCLLLEGGGSAGRRILIDGGMASSYTKHVSPALGALRDQKQEIDLIYISHIDDDHISGVRQMLDDLVAWRVFDYHRCKGNPHPKPTSRRPPKPKAIWHNGFRDAVRVSKAEIRAFDELPDDKLKEFAAALLDRDVGAIDARAIAEAEQLVAETQEIAADIEQFAATTEEMLGAAATILSASRADELRIRADEYRDLANGVASALQVSRRIGGGQLDIKLNPEFDSQMMYIRDADMPPPIKLGGLTLSVLGPRAVDLKRLLVDWAIWLRDHQKQVQEIKRRAKEDEDLLTAGGVVHLFRPLREQADRLAALEPALGKRNEMGDRKGVTAPNLASLMLLVEEKSGTKTKTVLLTGDGHADDVIAGLDYHKKLNKKLNPKGCCHVNVLKVQHHGANNNMTKEFAERITADHYVFCGNGAHDNPEELVIQTIVEARLKGIPRANGPAGKKFKLWFNCDASVDEGSANPEHMAKIQKLVGSLAKDSKKKMEFKFLDAATSSSFELTI